MGALTIRNLDDAILAAIKRRAGEHGVSVEEEVRRLLASAYTEDSQNREKAWALRQLRKTLHDSIERGGVVTDEQLDAALAEKSAQLAKEGF
jgi:plasmid stability protein